MKTKYNKRNVVVNHMPVGDTVYHFLLRSEPVPVEYRSEGSCGGDICLHVGLGSVFDGWKSIRGHRDEAVVAKAIELRATLTKAGLL